jgi:hypothetical protein
MSQKSKKDILCEAVVGEDYIINPTKYRYHSARCAVRYPNGPPGSGRVVVRGSNSLDDARERGAITAALKSIKSPPTIPTAPRTKLEEVYILADTMPKFIVDMCKFMKKHKSIKNIDERYSLALKSVPNNILFTNNSHVKWSVLSLI